MADKPPEDAVANAPKTVRGVEFLLMYRDHPLPNWHQYASYLSAEKARETMDRLVQKARPQGVDFRIVEVQHTRTYDEIGAASVPPRPTPTAQEVTCPHCNEWAILPLDTEKREQECFDPMREGQLHEWQAAPVTQEKP